MKKSIPQEKLLTACRDCAASCLGIVSMIISHPIPPEEHAFDCFLYCRECYNECMSSPEEATKFCGKACEDCADMMKELMLFNLN